MQTIFTTRGRRALTITTIALAGMAVLSFAIGGRDGGEAVGDEPVAEAGRVDRAAHISRYAPASAPGNAETDMVQVRQIDDMLAAAIAATQQYREVDRALADGYQPVTGVLTGSAMHFVSQRALEDAGFDVTRPEVLLYDDTAGGSLDLVGVAYLLPQHSASATPLGHFGPLAHWHAHRYRWPCLTVRREGPPVTVDRGDEACRATGNIVFPTRFWMLHVWLFRPGPDGVFSESNSTVKAAEVLVDGQAR